MKRTFRLTALILALLMLVNISALATTEGYPVSGVDMAFYNQILQSASNAVNNANVNTADEEAYHWGFTTGDVTMYESENYGAILCTVPANTLVKAFEFVNQAMYKIEYNGVVGYISGQRITACKCPNKYVVTDPAVHEPTCIYPKYFNELATSKSANELATMWSTFTAGEQAYILTYLETNTELVEKYWTMLAIIKTADELYTMWSTFTTESQAYILTYLETNIDAKHDELLGMLNPPVVQPDKEATTEDGTKVTVKGSNIPADVSLSLEPVDPTIVLPEFSQLGENLQYVALDVKLLQGNAVWQPAEKVQVTISAEKLGENGETVALFHKHGDNATEILGAYQIKENKLTFEMSGFSYLLGVNAHNIVCWIDDLADMTIQQRYDFLTQQTMTAFWLFMEHYVLEHSETNLVCTCGFSNTDMQIFAPGAENHKSGCPWAFGNLSLQEQLLTLFPKETEWLETATEDMIRRALRASSMESVLLENADLSNDLTQNAELYYVRSGKAIAYYQYEAANNRGVIIEPSCDLVIAYVNVATGAVTPVAEALANN